MSSGAPTPPVASPDARRARLFELIRFALVGGVSTLVYFAIYSALVIIGLPYGLASVGGWATSVSFGFVMHHRFTFKTGETGAAGLVPWLMLQTVVLVLNFLGLSLLVHKAGFTRIEAQLTLLPLIPLLSYVLSSRFIFAAPEEPAT